MIGIFTSTPSGSPTDVFQCGGLSYPSRESCEIDLSPRHQKTACWSNGFSLNLVSFMYNQLLQSALGEQ